VIRRLARMRVCLQMATRWGRRCRSVEPKASPILCVFNSRLHITSTPNPNPTRVRHMPAWCTTSSPLGRATSLRLAAHSRCCGPTSRCVAIGGLGLGGGGGGEMMLEERSASTCSGYCFESTSLLTADSQPHHSNLNPTPHPHPNSPYY